VNSLVVVLLHAFVEKIFLKVDKVVFKCITLHILCLLIMCVVMPVQGYGMLRIAFTLSNNV